VDRRADAELPLPKTAMLLDDPLGDPELGGGLLV